MGPREEIRSLITEVQEYKFERRDFVGAGKGQEVTLDQQVDGPGLGVVHRRPARTNHTPSSAVTFWSPGDLDWKLGKSEKVDFMFRYRAPGLSITETKPPRALPQGDNWLILQRESIGAGVGRPPQ